MKDKASVGTYRASTIIAALSSSLTLHCVLIVLVYAALVLGVFSLVNAVAEDRLNTAFPTINSLEEHEDALAYDKFDELKASISSSSELLIFDDDDNRLYASSSEIAQTITAEDLAVINGSDEDRTFYEVLERKDESGSTVYEIALCSWDTMSNALIVQSSCICTEDGEIISGDLFGDRTNLTERELSLIRGIYSIGMTIQKYEYETADGEGRTMVLVAPTFNGSAYDAAVAEAETLRFIAIPAAGILTVVAVLLLVRVIRRAIRPLDDAIDARKSSVTVMTPAPTLALEFRPTYENFTELMAELDAERDDKQRIIADISHDLKTPLTVIRGYAQAFEDGRVEPGKAEEYLKAIEAKSRTASDLIDTLFEYAKADHPSFEPQLESCDLCEALRLIAIDRQDEIEQAGCVLDVSIPDEPLSVHIDRALFARAVGNLLNNACKHNPSGTRIELACVADGGSAFVAVSDTGTGIPANIRAHIFEPFVTSNEARQSNKGTGIGLSISDKYVRLMGGTLTISDTPRAPFATEIIIELPLLLNGSILKKPLD